MRLNRSTLLSIMVMLLFGLVLSQAESFLGDYQIYIAKLIFINAILALSLNLIYGFTGLFFAGARGFYRHRRVCIGPVHPEPRAKRDDVDSRTHHLAFF